MSAELVGIISVGVGLALALFALWGLSLKPLQANVEALRTNLTETNRWVRELAPGGDRMTRLKAVVTTKDARHRLAERVARLEVALAGATRRDTSPRE